MVLVGFWLKKNFLLIAKEKYIQAPPAQVLKGLGKRVSLGSPWRGFAAKLALLEGDSLPS